MMDWKSGCAGLVLAAMSVVSIPRAASAASLTANFEGGTLDGWTVIVPPGGDASVVSTVAKLGEEGDWTSPAGGNSFAYLRTDGPGSFTMLSKAFEGEAGHTLSFDIFFDAGDFYPNNDRGLVVLRDGAGFFHELYDMDVLRVGNFGSDGWTHISYTLPRSGTFTIDFQVSNIDRELPYSYSAMGIDNFAVAPLPASVWGGLSLLTAVGAARAWRRQRGG